MKQFEVDGEEVEVVESFSFLGFLIHSDGNCSDEIKRRLAMGPASMSKLVKNHEKS